MPKIGAEASRKAALVDAAIAAVGRSGTQDVTVAKIAREAGMSPALAHHYFGSKGDIFLAAMRHILSRYGEGVRAALREQIDSDTRRLAEVDESEVAEVEQQLADEHDRLSGGLPRAVEIGVVDEIVEPTRTRSAVATALAEAPARRGEHGNIPL